MSKDIFKDDVTDEQIREGQAARSQWARNTADAIIRRLDGFTDEQVEAIRVAIVEQLEQ